VELVHLDISDGVFTKTLTWNNPKELEEDMPLELHLMVKNPHEAIEIWSEHNLRRVIVHIDSISREEFDLIVEHSELHNIEVVPAVSAGDPTRRLLRYIEEFQFRSAFVLAVPPGPSGHKFDERALDAIREINAKFPKISIAVDGGVNLEVGARAQEAGADTLVSTSYIWESKDPSAAYEELKNL